MVRGAAFNALNAAALAVLAACASGGNEAPAADPAPASDRAAPGAPGAPGASGDPFYRCGDARVMIREGAALVLDGEDALRLPEADGTPGARFESAAARVVRQGGRVVLSRPGAPDRPCVPADEADDGPALPVTARAPGWRVRVGPDALVLSSDERAGPLAGPLSPPERRGRIARWSAPTSGGTVSVSLRPGLCTLAVGGLPYPYLAEIALDGDVRSGCGGAPGALLLGTWRLGPEAPVAEVTFAEDGRLTGDTGCNRLSGGYAADERGLRVGPLAVTRRACPRGGAQERRLLAGLRSATRFEVTARGELIVHGAAGELIFERSTR